jgi:hypothetical protein
MTEDQFAQEYLCSFDAAIVGAIYGTEMRQATEQGRVCEVPHDPSLPVHTAWDLGWKDDTAIWWYQVVRGEIHVLDYFAASGSTIRELAEVVLAKPYRYGKHFLPHDARAKTLASGGKSIIEQMAEFLGIQSLRIVPELGLQNGIQAVRRMLPRCWFHVEHCADGIEALKQYQREYDEDKKAFRAQPLHNWCSHPADAFRMLAVAWEEEPKAATPPQEKVLIVGPQNEVTMNDMWQMHENQQPRRARL